MARNRKRCVLVGF